MIKIKNCLFLTIFIIIIMFIYGCDKQIDYITIKEERYSTSLTELDLSGFGLQNEDIVPLKYMTNLAVLYLHATEISDITPLAELTNLEQFMNLTHLALDYNQISDISPLANLENLTDLGL